MSFLAVDDVERRRFRRPLLGIRLDNGTLSDETATELAESDDTENGHLGFLLLYEAARLAIKHRVAFVLAG